jgi:tight adherence protein C
VENGNWITPTLMLGGGIFLFIGLLSTFVYMAFIRKDRTNDRVDRLEKRAPSAVRRRTEDNPIKKFLARLAGADKAGEGGRSRLSKQLIMAGIRHPAAATRFGLARLLLLIVLPAAWLVLPGTREMAGKYYWLVLVALFLVAYMGPTYLLRFRIAKRQDEIRRTLPDVVDLLVVCVEAGLGLDAAVRRVGEDMALSAPILAQEFRFLSLELAAGTARPVAMKHLAERTGVEEVGSLVSMINQADRFGVSIGRSLRVHSETVRTARRQKLEEKAAKTSLKLLFPLLFCIFPTILVVIGGPAAIKIFGLFFAK